MPLGSAGDGPGGAASSPLPAASAFFLSPCSCSFSSPRLAYRPPLFSLSLFAILFHLYFTFLLLFSFSLVSFLVSPLFYSLFYILSTLLFSPSSSHSLTLFLLISPFPSSHSPFPFFLPLFPIPLSFLLLPFSSSPCLFHYFSFSSTFSFHLFPFLLFFFHFLLSLTFLSLSLLSPSLIAPLLKAKGRITNAALALWFAGFFRDVFFCTVCSVSSF